MYFVIFIDTGDAFLDIIKYSLQFEEMKTKSISFAEVLRKNARSPKSEATQGLRLSDLVQQFQMNPREDYTLHLGKCNTSQRSKPTKMGYSRNTPDSLVFDSWIQKQSSLGNNKENIRSQRTTPHEPKKSDVGFRKFGFQSKPRQQWQPTANSKTSQRHSEYQPLEESQQNYPQLHIEMIKSNGYEAEPVGKVKSPQVQKVFRHEQVKQKRTPPMLFKTQPTFKQLKEAQQQRGNYLKADEKMDDFTSFPREQPNQSFQTKRVEEDLDEITSKYRDKYESDGEVQEEELLLAQSNERAEEIVCKEEQVKNVDKNDEILKKRLDDAKNLIGNYFDKIKKGKQEQPQKVVHAHNHVGYSFSSSNFLNQHPPNQLTNIQIPVAEQPQIQVEQPLRDSDFRNKYLNLQSFEEPNSIKNIESVKYEGSKVEEEKAYEVPSDSFKVKLISSNEKQSGDCIQAAEHNHQAVLSPKEQPKTIIFTETNQSIQDNTKTFKSRQKISLISSRSKSKSNKSSPTAVQQPPVEAPQTTDFTLNEKTVEKKQSIHILPKTENIGPIVTQSKTPVISVVKQSGYSAFIAEKKSQLSSQYTAPTYAQPTSMYNLPKLPNYSGQSYPKFNETYYATANPIQPPSYTTYATKPALVTSKIYQNAPLKIETPFSAIQKQENKKRVSFAEAAEVYEQRSDKQPKKNYLSRLDIKESITMEEPKSKIQVTFSKNNYGLASRQYKTTIIPSNPLKQSLKESINLSESGEFAFDL